MPDDIRQIEQAVVISPPRQMRRSAIKNLVAQLPERGKLKIGARGKMITSKQGNEFQPPVKLDYFRITTLRRCDDGNLERDEGLHQRFGDKPSEIPVRLLYDDPALNFPTRYAAFIGRTLWCSGDGETALRLTKEGDDKFEISCPCRLSDPSYQPKRGDPPRCKMNGALSVIIDGASGLGGVWKFRTTSYNSITGIMGAMIFIRQITGGPLANIPLKLRVQPKNATAPTDGSPVLIYVVSLEFDGNVTDLQRMGHQIALDRATTHVSIAEIETEARRMLALAGPADAPLPGDEPEDIVAEFYPEQMTEEDASPPPRQTRPRPEDYIDSDATSETASFEIVDLDGELHKTRYPEKARDKLLELIGEAKQLGCPSLDGLWGSNAAVILQIGDAASALLHEAYDDAKKAFEQDPGNGQDRPAAGAQPSDPASLADAEDQRHAALIVKAGQTEHPEGEERSPQGERSTPQELPAARAATPAAVHRTNESPRDERASLAFDLARYKPAGGPTDWERMAKDMVTKIAEFTDLDATATNGWFVQQNRGALEGMRTGNKPQWSEVNYRLAERYRVLKGGAP